MQTIATLGDLCEWLGLAPEDYKRLSKAIYKGTDCGAWVRVREEGGDWQSPEDFSGPEVDLEMVQIGSIVEGSDAEFDMEYGCPVDASVLDEWLEELESLTSQEWDRANNEHFLLRDPEGHNVAVVNHGDKTKVHWLCDVTPALGRVEGMVKGLLRREEHLDHLGNGATTEKDDVPFEVGKSKWVLRRYEPEIEL
jgi:hypothetical protein